MMLVLKEVQKILKMGTFSCDAVDIVRSIMYRVELILLFEVLGESSFYSHFSEGCCLHSNARNRE